MGGDEKDKEEAKPEETKELTATEGEGEGEDKDVEFKLEDSSEPKTTEEKAEEVKKKCCGCCKVDEEDDGVPEDFSTMAGCVLHVHGRARVHSRRRYQPHFFNRATFNLTLSNRTMWCDVT